MFLLRMAEAGPGRNGNDICRHVMPAHCGWLFSFERNLVMYKPVLAPCAVTTEGEWVTPQSVALAEYSSLFCLSCRLKIVVHSDPLTGLKTFVHLPQMGKETALRRCRYNRAAQEHELNENHCDLVNGPPRKRALSVKTTVQRWQCGWCHLCWKGEKYCPVCEDWIFAFST